MYLRVDEHTNEFQILVVLAQVIPVIYQVVDVRGCHLQGFVQGWAEGVRCQLVVALYRRPW